MFKIHNCFFYNLLQISLYIKGIRSLNILQIKYLLNFMIYYCVNHTNTHTLELHSMYINIVTYTHKHLIIKQIYLFISKLFVTIIKKEI